MRLEKNVTLFELYRAKRKSLISRALNFLTVDLILHFSRTCDFLFIKFNVQQKTRENFCVFSLPFFSFISLRSALPNLLIGKIVFFAQHTLFPRYTFRLNYFKIISIV